MEKMYFSVKEAAAYIGVSVHSMYAICKSEGFPVVCLSERRMRIPVDKFREWIESKGMIK